MHIIPRRCQRRSLGLGGSGASGVPTLETYHKPGRMEGNLPIHTDSGEVKFKMTSNKRKTGNSEKPWQGGSLPEEVPCQTGPAIRMGIAPQSMRCTTLQQEGNQQTILQALGECLACTASFQSHYGRRKPWGEGRK